MVARGLSNREIGPALKISEHTAANHIRSILRKTDCANRTEAATYAHRHGLVAIWPDGHPLPAYDRVFFFLFFFFFFFFFILKCRYMSLSAPFADQLESQRTRTST